MKYYDRNLSKINTNIKSILLVLVTFVIGFLVGYIVGGGELFNSHHDEKQNIIQNQVKNVSQAR